MVANRFVGELVAGTFASAGGQTLRLDSSGKWDNEFLPFYTGAENDQVVRALRAWYDRYKGMDISNVAVTQISRIPPSAADAANQLGETVTFVLNWAERPKGSTGAWQNHTGDLLTLRQVEYGVGGAPSGSWRVWNFSL